VKSKSILPNKADDTSFPPFHSFLVQPPTNAHTYAANENQSGYALTKPAMLVLLLLP
jgi:hypothetical protein